MSSLLLRGRRLGLALVLGLLTLTPGCATETDDDDDVVGLTGDELTKAGGVKVVQCNPYFAGAFAYPDRMKAPKDWSTAEQFARAMQRDKSEGTVVGMQEMTTAGNAEKVRELLGPNWAVQHWTAEKDGEFALGVAVFYRTDRHELVKDLGKFAVDRIDSDRFGKAAYPVLWGGVVLREKSVGKPFAVFTGKLVWAAQEKNGKTYDDQATRVAEVGRLNAWIDTNLEPYPGVTRIVTTDLNDDRGSPAWREMGRRYADGGATQTTWRSPRSGTGYRFDHVFWDDKTEAKRRTMGFPTPYTSTKFTSDHQFVTADIPLR